MAEYMQNQCDECVYNTSVQRYMRACNAPARLAQYKRKYYVEVFETAPCKNKKSEKQVDKCIIK